MLIVYWPFLFSGKVIYGDPIFWEVPIWNFLRQSLMSGDSFLWNPLNAGGFPIYAEVAGFFFPLHQLLLRWLPAVDVFHWLTFIAGIFALFLTIQFLKELGVKIYAALIGGLSFVISEIWFLPDITALSYALVFLPLLFLIILKLARSIRPLWWALGGGLAIGLAWLSVMPHFVLWILIAVGTFVLHLSLRVRSWRMIGWFLVMNLIGLAIGLIQLWPIFWVAQLSARGAGVPYSLLVEDPIRLLDLNRFFFPDFYSFLPIYRTVDGIAQGAEVSLYMGITPFLFFVASFFHKFLYGRFFKGLFFVSLAIGISKSPLFWLITKVPVLNTFRVPSRFMLIGAFAGAILVGLAANEFFKRSLSKFLTPRFFKIISVSIFFLIVSLILIFVFRWVNIQDGITLKKFILNVIWLISSKTLIPIGILICAWLAIKFFYRQKFSRLAIQALVLLSILDFILVFNFSVVNIPIFTFQKTYIVDFLKDYPGRAIILFPDQFIAKLKKGGWKPNREGDFIINSNILLSPNLNLLYGVEIGNYYEKLLSRDVARLWGMIGVQTGEIFDPITDFSDLINLPLGTEIKLAFIERRRSLLDFFGVNYVISGATLDGLAMGIVGNLNITNENNESVSNLFIYENKNAKSLFYFVNQIDGFDTDKNAIFSKFKESDFNGIFLECGDCALKDFSGDGEINLIERKNGRVKLIVNSSGEQFLIFSQNYYPGWRAFINGNETPIFRVNTVYMGIFLPAGQHDVKFEYSYYLPW